MIEQRVITDRDEWLRWRREDITASNCGALFGCHPYATALRLYVEKRGVEFEQPDDRVLRRGRWLEPAVRLAVAEKHPEWQIEPANTYFRDPNLRLGATPDFFIRGDQRGLGILQAKTIAPSVFAREWNEGTECPFWITLQTLTEMLLTDAAFGVIGGLVVDPFAMDCHIIEIPRNASAEIKIVAAVSKFWDDVREGNEPAPDYGKDAAVIAALNPRETPGKQIDLSGNNELPGLLDLHATLTRNIKKNKERCDEVTAQVKHIMGDAEIANLRDFRITFKTQETKGYVVKPRSSRVLRISDKRPSAAAEDAPA